MNETWYYADQKQQQQGPVDASVIAELYRQQQLGADSLVWREGLPDWQPLSRHFGVFGITPPATDPGHSAPPAFVPPTRPPVAGAASASGQATTVVQAGFARRLGAYILDSLILTFTFYALLVVLMIAAAAMGGLSGLDGKEPSAGLVIGYFLALLLYYVGAGLYYGLQESGPHQATLGKRALGIKVTDSFGQRLTFSHALGRWAAASLSYVTLYIGFFMAGFTERKQALHDLLAGTFVVDRWAHTDTPEKQSTASSGCLVAAVVAAVALGLVMVLGILAAIAIPAYQDYTIRAKLHGAIAEAAPAKIALQEFIANTDRCPRDASELGLAAPASAQLRSIGTGERDGRCLLQIELAGIEGAYDLDGKRVWLELQDNGQWQCSSDAPSKYLPTNCR